MARSSGQVTYVAATVPISIIMTVVCLFIANDDVTHARSPTTYIVGDEFGWDPVFLMDTWAEGKTFYAGDILEFKYDYQISNVMVVNETGYDTCVKRTMKRKSIHPVTIRSNFLLVIAITSEHSFPKMAINALAPPI